MDVAEIRKLENRSVFVTGAGGFIGGRIADALMEAGARVSALARSPRAADALRARSITPVTGQLDPSLDLTGQEIVFNLAHDFRAPAQESLAGFDALLAAMTRAGVPRLVHAASAVVYDAWPDGDIDETGSSTPGGNAYRQAKIAMTERLMQSDLEVAVLEPTIVYGPGGWLWTDGPVEKLLSGKVILPEPVGQCHAVHVADVAQAALRAAVLPDLGQERFVISSGEAITWADFFEGYQGILGRGEIAFRPLDALQDGLGPQAAPSTTAAQPPLAARLGALARKRLGKATVDRARVLALKLRRLKGPVVHAPDHYAVSLYSARGTCSADHAKARLGFQPQYDLRTGQQDCAAYINARFG